MPRHYFITGTDTDIGKTYVSTCLLRAFSKEGFATLGVKPIASGGNDVKQLQAASSIKLPLNIINPISFDLSIAPHLAAKKMGCTLSVDELVEKTKPALDYPADIHIIEGAGGFLVPLNHTETMADFVVRCNFSVILVIGIRLGCLNHALLTYEAIKLSSARFTGWIANCVDPFASEIDEMIETLQEWIPRYLGKLDYGSTHFSIEVSPDEKDSSVPSESFISK